MKKFAIVLFLCAYFQLEAQPIFSEQGYPEHFIVGSLIGGVTSYFVFKKTDNKFKSWIIGTAAASAAGFIKEAIDPKLLSKVGNPTDALYTTLGGAFGASIVIPLKKRKAKRTPNITAAFNTNYQKFAIKENEKLRPGELILDANSL